MLGESKMQLNRSGTGGYVKVLTTSTQVNRPKVLQVCSSNVVSQSTFESVEDRSAVDRISKAKDKESANVNTNMSTNQSAEYTRALKGPNTIYHRT